MPQWSDSDAASNSANFAPAQFNAVCNSTTQTALFGNTTGNNLIAGITVAQVGVDAGEAMTARATGVARPAHPGWNLKITGSGNRADRVTYECLAAMKTLITDASDDAVLPDYALRVLTNPSNATVNASSASNVATFTVAGVSIPTGATINYYWQKWGGSAFANLAASGAYSNVTTATLSVLGNTASNGEIYRAAVASANGSAATVYSANAVLTITT